jgi:hypothetical protein
MAIVGGLQISGAQQSIGFPGTLDIHLVPLPLIDRNPRLRLGMEYHSRQHLGYSLEAGFGNNQLNQHQLANGPFGNEYSFYEIHPEVKWYRKEESMFATYFSAGMFYMHMKDKLEHQYYYEDGDPSLPVDYEAASFTKEKIGFQAKAGIKFLFIKRIILDFHEGFGIAYRNISYSNVINPMRPDFSPFEEWFVAPYKNEGRGFVFQLAFGFRIGYLIAKSDTP